MQWKKYFGRRLLALLLVMCAVLTCFPVTGVSVSGEEPESTATEPPAEPTTPAVVESEGDSFFDSVKIYCEGQEYACGELTPDQHITLTAQYEGDTTNSTYTWQIYSPAAAQWVRIGGEERASLQVGYALLSGMCDESGLAMLNCKVSQGGNLYYSNTVKIQVVDGMEDAEPDPVPGDAFMSYGIATIDDDPISGGELQTCTVTVEYIDYLKYMEYLEQMALGHDLGVDHYKVRSDFIATVKYGTQLSLAPECPTVAGYTACVLEDESGRDYTAENGGEVVFADGTDTYYGKKVTKLQLTLDSITENKLYRVYYFPNKVNYTVSHYVQNATNDGYTLYFSQVLEGYVDTLTAAQDLTVVDSTDPFSLKGKGYIALVPFTNEKIAADGSTQIEAYYDRAYFLMTFKLADGTGTEPVYARAGSPVYLEKPKRQGYDFAGWVVLQMAGLAEGADPYHSTPLPAVDASGNYIYLYIKDGEPVYDDQGNMVTLTRNEDGTWTRNDTGDLCTDHILQMEDMPTQMPAFHSAYQALWTESNTHYSVIYWLEQADYSADPTKAGYCDAEGVQYDYWHALTLEEKTGTVLSITNTPDQVTYLENPLSKEDGGTGVAISSFYEVVTVGTDDLTGSYVIYSENAGKSVEATSVTASNVAGLERGEFSPGQKEQTKEWTFTAVTGGGYYLSSDGQYLKASGNALSFVATQGEATVFTITQITDSNTIAISYTQGDATYYLNNYNGNNAVHFALWNGGGTGDANNRFKLYAYAEKSDPEAAYYYYYYSSFRDQKGEVDQSITVQADGSTVINVYWRRREYHLRFFYARETADGKKQVVGGTSYGFSDTNGNTSGDTTTTDGLLANLEDYGTAWGTVNEIPSLNNNDGFYNKGTLTSAGDTYYYFTLNARYGQNIAKEWPSDVMGTTTLVNDLGNEKPAGWTSKIAVFSAWNGEYWLKYSVDERAKRANGSNANFTIKGNYQQLDEKLLYDPSFNETYPVSDGNDPYNLRGTTIDYGDETVVRYLDFIAFFENGHENVGWSVPSQYHYYLWIKYDTTGMSAEAIEALETQALKPVSGTMGEDQALPQGITDFDNMVENSEEKRGTIVYIDYLDYDETDNVDGTFFVLYDKVDCCDNSTNPNMQTIPSIPGYTHIDQTFRGEYLDYYTDSTTDEDALSAKSYAYVNTQWDRDVYLHSYSLHFIYTPEIRTITLSSGGYTKDIPTPYGTMTGANDIENNYQAAQMEALYYPRDLDKGTHVFAGWYKSASCLPGTEAKLDRAMPNYNIMLYAKWVPRNYSVEVYQTSDQDHYVRYLNTVTNEAGVEVVEHSPMVSLAQMVEVDSPNFPGQKIQIPLEGAGKPYGSPLPDVVSDSGPDLTKQADGEYTIPENVMPDGDVDPDWIFVCWAYMDADGEEHAIDVNSFTISEDVKIYAKWTASTIINYEIRYELANVTASWIDNQLVYTGAGRENLVWHEGQLCTAVEENGTTVYTPYAITGTEAVADPLKGRRNAGVNRTFSAKTEEELYAQFQTHYFPLYSSHTLLMRLGEECSDANCPYCTGETRAKIGEDANHPLVQIFYYVHIENVPYTVQYLDINGNTLATAKTMSTGATVVTENYVYVSGYVPDAFQKTKILSANPAENNIIFYYTPSDTTDRPYTVVYYQETLTPSANTVPYEGKDYMVYQTVSGSCPAGQEFTVQHHTLNGYEYFETQITAYTSQDLGTTQSTVQSGLTELTLDVTELALEDLRGDKATLKVVGNDIQITCGNELHNHTCENSVFYFTYNDVKYALRSATVVDGSLVVQAYTPPTESIKVTSGEYGTLVEVYYDLKSYPYFVYHEVKGETSNTVLAIELDKAKLGEEVHGTSWTQLGLIEKGYPGYTVNKDTTDMIITITIEDDSEKPLVNTMTFYYYEKPMTYNYEVLVQIKDEGLTTIQPLDDPNAKVNVSTDVLDAVSDQAKVNIPVYNPAAYEFVGWYLDAACTELVNDDPTYDSYVNGTTLEPQKLTEFRYLDNGVEKMITFTGNNAGAAFYAGPYDSTTGTYATEQTFYALFEPVVGELTIVRNNIGPDKDHDEANSFVYTITGDNNFRMQVTINPGETSVKVYNLPVGTYTVTQENDWSWRYSDPEKTATLTKEDLYTTVTFDGNWIGNWLSGFDALVNEFGKLSGGEGSS